MPQQFTVLLLYPDYMSDAFGHETYQAHVRALYITQAIRLAQAQAMKANPGSIEDHNDLHVLAVYAGHLNDLKP